MAVRLVRGLITTRGFIIETFGKMERHAMNNTDHLFLPFIPSLPVFFDFLSLSLANFLCFYLSLYLVFAITKIGQP